MIKKIKKLNLVPLLMLILVLVVSCAPKPATIPTAPVVVEPEVAPEIAVTGESSVDEVAEDISASVDTDEELDTSELDDVDDILTEIENI